MENKLTWINNIKGFGIFIVVLGHISSPFSDFIFSWHMPLFFFISGFFIKVDLPVVTYLKKDFIRLMIPYLLFSFLGITVEVLKRIALNREGLDYLNEFLGVFIWMDFISLKNTYAFVLWFLPTLFVSRFCVLVIMKFLPNRILTILVICFLFYISFRVDLIFSIDNALNAVLFIYLGFLFYNKIEIFKTFHFFLILTLVVSVIYLYYGIPKLDMSTKVFENIGINIIWSISIICLLILSFNYFKVNNKLLEQWGSNTMILFIFHPYTNNIAHLIAEKIYYNQWFLKILLSIILLQLLIIIKSKYERRWLFRYV